jgi:hypothetical protein
MISNGGRHRLSPATPTLSKSTSVSFGTTPTFRTPQTSRNFPDGFITPRAPLTQSRIPTSNRFELERNKPVSLERVTPTIDRNTTERVASPESVKNSTSQQKTPASSGKVTTPEMPCLESLKKRPKPKAATSPQLPQFRSNTVRRGLQYGTPVRGQE